MKNLTKFGMMLLAAALCVGMSSCSDDDDKEVGVGGSLSFASNNPLISKGKKLLTKIVTESDYDDESYSFMYDSHFRPIKIRYGCSSNTPRSSTSTRWKPLWMAMSGKSLPTGQTTARRAHP